MEKNSQPEINYRKAAEVCNELHKRIGAGESGLQAEYEKSVDEVNSTFKIWKDSDPENSEFQHYGVAKKAVDSRVYVEYFDPDHECDAVIGLSPNQSHSNDGAITIASILDAIGNPFVDPKSFRFFTKCD